MGVCHFFGKLPLSLPWQQFFLQYASSQQQTGGLLDVLGMEKAASGKTCLAHLRHILPSNSGQKKLAIKNHCGTVILLKENVRSSYIIYL